MAIRRSRTLPKSARVTSVIVSKDRGGRYFVSLQCEDEVAPKVELGIDLGLSHFAVFSSGEKFESQRFFVRHERRLATLRRRFARKKKGSNRSAKARLKLVQF